MTSVMTTHQVPKDAAQRRHWVIYQLRVKGTNIRKFADEIGVKPQAVSAALFSPSSHIETALAKKLGLKPQQLFPERFDSAGHRLHATRSQQRSRGQHRRNVQVSGAA